MLEGERVTQKRRKRKTEGRSSSTSSTKGHVALRPPAISSLTAISNASLALDNMPVSSRAVVIGILLVTAIVSVLLLSPTTWRLEHAFSLVPVPITPASRSSSGQNLMATLNIASRIYVISLPKDLQRRMDMEQLRYTIGLEFTYVNGTEGDEDTVEKIMGHVTAFRALRGLREAGLPLSTAFEWPQDVDALVESEKPLDMSGSDLWVSDDIDPPDLPSREPLTCAHGDSTLEPYSPQTPSYRLLTKGRLACWHSHWRVIRSIANGQDGVAIVLEDDVDMELDIRQRLLGVWDSLPSEWDIVFLGADREHDKVTA